MSRDEQAKATGMIVEDFRAAKAELAAVQSEIDRELRAYSETVKYLEGEPEGNSLDLAIAELETIDPARMKARVEDLKSLMARTGVLKARLSAMGLPLRD
jgi:hypothetical protein